MARRADARLVCGSGASAVAAAAAVVDPAAEGVCSVNAPAAAAAVDEPADSPVDALSPTRAALHALSATGKWVRNTSYNRTDRSLGVAAMGDAEDRVGGADDAYATPSTRSPLLPPPQPVLSPPSPPPLLQLVLSRAALGPRHSASLTQLSSYANGLTAARSPSIEGTSAPDEDVEAEGSCVRCCCLPSWALLAVCV